MKKILILFFISIALLSCCDNSNVIGLMVCQDNEFQSKILWNYFIKGAGILSCTIIVIYIFSATVYNLKNKPKIFEESFDANIGWIFPLLWIGFIIMWAIAVYLFNIGELLKYIGIA